MFDKVSIHDTLCLLLTDPFMQQNCTQCSAGFVITDEDRAFYDRMEVPAPKNCPECRLQRRLCERNTRHLYYRKCDLTGKQIISQYRPSQPFPVYGIEAWGGDGWDGLTYGKDIDWNRPFFEQFKELADTVPHLALFNTPGTMENSDYNNCTGYLKNCYLIAESDFCEDCFYSNLLKKAKNLVDCSVCYECELCFECIDCLGSQRLMYSQDCQNCHDSFFLKNCISCHDCIGCVNQRHKQYMIFNKQYTKEEYEASKAAMNLDTRAGIETLRAQCEEFFPAHPYCAQQIEQCENSSGDRLYESKNAFQCFDCKNVEDCRYCQLLSLNCKDCMDFNSWGQESQLIYQCSSTGDRAYNSKFCSTCITVSNCDYCLECTNSSDLFGCVGLRRNKFCILNKQYSEEEYKTLRAKLIEHMKKPPSTGSGQASEYGEFFPMNICAFAYNEAFVMDSFPLSKEDVEKRGWTWYEEPDSESKYMGAAVELPETIADVSDDICKKILQCKATGKAYKIIPQELKFYRSMNVPAPDLSPDERHRLRIAKRNPQHLWKRNCDNCKKEIDSSYAPDRPETIFCKDCYLSSVY